MLTSEASVATVNASLYLKKLCKHFQHKVEAQWDDHQGIAHFPMGIGTFAATADRLTMRCQAETQEALEKVQWIIDDHLIRFARKENLVPQWRGLVAGQ
ncbi:MAG TPA: DUF2218 domain-containing protein [Candidatus Kapabacteria bacterium]|nr:DUF2218 domain-containing protein [Candidatus Kapabacteria bacterium]